MTATSTPTPVRPSTAPAERPSTAARRFGYLVAALVDAAMLYAVNVWPGWDTLPFLTDSTRDVLLALNISIVAGLLVNLVYLAHDPLWLRGLGDMVTTGLSLVALVRIWDVFPLDLTESWELAARILLALGIVGTAIGFVAGLVAFARNVGAR